MDLSPPHRGSLFSFVALAALAGCAAQGNGESMRPTTTPEEVPVTGAAPSRPPVAAPPTAPVTLADPSIARLADLEIEGICPNEYFGAEANRRRFFESAANPIATVKLGHYRHTDVSECISDRPPTVLATVAVPRLALRPGSKARELTLLSGDLLRPLDQEECTAVYVCDDANRNGACDDGEAQLNSYNDRSRYLPASVSRRARFSLTPLSREDRFCGGQNYNSRCCPDRWIFDAGSGKCLAWNTSEATMPSCP